MFDMDPFGGKKVPCQDQNYMDVGVWNPNTWWETHIHGVEPTCMVAASRPDFPKQKGRPVPSARSPPARADEVRVIG